MLCQFKMPPDCLMPITRCHCWSIDASLWWKRTRLRRFKFQKPPTLRLTSFRRPRCTQRPSGLFFSRAHAHHVTVTVRNWRQHGELIQSKGEQLQSSKVKVRCIYSFQFTVLRECTQSVRTHQEFSSASKHRFVALSTFVESWALSLCNKNYNSVGSFTFV